ncbi:hypothetical protein ACFSVJ_10405 [Prauserella oleivorans]
MRQLFANLLDLADLADVLADRDIPLVLMGAAPLRDALAGENLAYDMERTASRPGLLREG